MTSSSQVLLDARDHFQVADWARAYACFEAADESRGLPPADLVLYARSAFLLGREADCSRLLTRAYQQHADADELLLAAECAFWHAFVLMHRGDLAQAGGWLARAERLVEDAPSVHPVRGLLLVPRAMRALGQGDTDTSLDLFRHAREAGRHTRNPDLEALGGLGLGRTLIARGDPVGGMAVLDEVMVAVTAGEVSAVVAGIVYCAVIISCQESFEMRRAAEWTHALSRWCAEQPSLVPFRGQCLVHRAQVLALEGAWTDAEQELAGACRRLTEPVLDPAIGMALYEQAELQRLRGRLAAAEEGYRRAAEHGHETQPGLALLRLAQGRVPTAQAGLRRALDETLGDRAGRRPRLLAAYVEVALSAGAVEDARTSADELLEIAEAHRTETLLAMAAQADGAVLVAEGRAGEALAALQRSGQSWRALAAPYQEAVVRVLRAVACRTLDDRDAAEMELAAASRVFRHVGAEPDLARVEALRGRPGRGPLGAAGEKPGGLSPREVEVLRAVATGKTNRGIAEDLGLSEKTVARHMSNIFSKLDLSSRSAATAYAYDHGFV